MTEDEFGAFEVVESCEECSLVGRVGRGNWRVCGAFRLVGRVKRRSYVVWFTVSRETVKEHWRDASAGHCMHRHKCSWCRILAGTFGAAPSLVHAL